jgi:ABC-type polysaccharide/polyol phosphate export permease
LAHGLAASKHWGGKLDTLKETLSFGLFLGWQDLRNSYQRTLLGPWWITLALGLQITAIGLLFGLLFQFFFQSFFIPKDIGPNE